MTAAKSREELEELTPGAEITDTADARNVEHARYLLRRDGLITSWERLRELQARNSPDLDTISALDEVLLEDAYYRKHVREHAERVERYIGNGAVLVSSEDDLRRTHGVKPGKAFYRHDPNIPENRGHFFPLKNPLGEYYPNAPKYVLVKVSDLESVDHSGALETMGFEMIGGKPVSTPVSVNIPPGPAGIFIANERLNEILGTRPGMESVKSDFRGPQTKTETIEIKDAGKEVEKKSLLDWQKEIGEPDEVEMSEWDLNFAKEYIRAEFGESGAGERWLRHLLTTEITKEEVEYVTRQVKALEHALKELEGEQIEKAKETGQLIESGEQGGLDDSLIEEYRIRLHDLKGKLLDVNDYNDNLVGEVEELKLEEK